MCGICGKVALDGGQQVDPGIVKNMMAALRHRGPDGEGMHVAPQVVLGHRRLAIIDLSTGKQPISNEDRTVWVVYNGEIYNFKELRKELVAKGHIFGTSSDTEVIVHLYEEYAERCVEKLRGMFAFALWDERKKVLLLARDRVGIKPLYYSLADGALVFASEIKAIILDPAVTREINPQVIDKFLTYLYTPGPETLFQNIRKLEPGHYLLLQGGKVTVKRYWDLEFPRENSNGSFRAATAELVTLLKETVRSHMISDVPVGILLSGGVDSTGLLSFAIEETAKEVKTFTIGFEGENFADERVFARLAAEKFGTRHYETTISAKDFLEFLPKYVWHLEEPVCEAPAVALYYVTKLASEHVKVLISGEGADEAFAGYQNYRNTVWLERFKAMGGPWRNAAASILGRLGRVPAMRRWERYSQLMHLPLERYYYSRTSDPFRFFNRRRSSFYSQDFQDRIGMYDSLECVRAHFGRVARQDVLSQMLYVDTKTWLPDDLLLKADKITMANSLELRVPFLDHKVLEFAARLPADYKVRGLTTKYILKKALEHRVPKPILSRKKIGFPVPVGTWFRNELRDFVWDVLMDRKTLARGYFKRQAIAGLLENTSDYAYYAPEIFSLITLELWHRCFVDASA